MKSLRSLVLIVALVPGCFAATGAAIGGATTKSPESRRAAIATGAAMGFLIDVAVASLVIGAASSAEDAYPYGRAEETPGHGATVLPYPVATQRR